MNQPLEGLKVETIAAIWLTLNGPVLETHMTCREASAWFVEAIAWARRSGVRLNEVGYMCAWERERPHR